MKARIKSLFTRNIGWKILSIIIAGLFWLIAVNIIDPTTKRTFEGVPVEILNESAITSANQVYEVLSGNTVDVTITSKRSLVERLNAGNFTATADLTELSSVNAVAIQVKLNKNPENVPYELDWGSAMLKVKLEERVSSKFKVEIQTEGELGEGYVLGTVKAKPNIIEVAGGISKMKKIDHVGAVIQLGGETEGFSVKAKPMAYDAMGDIVDATNLTFSATNIKVSVGVRRTMDVPIEITTVGQPAEGYHLIQTDRQPESVRVSAEDPELLTENLMIKLEVDIEGATSDVEKEIDITSYLGEDYVIEDGIKVVSVRCEIGRSGQRSLSFTGTDIEVKNLRQGYAVNFPDAEQHYQVSLSGSDDVLRDVTISDLNPYIDISGMGEGEHSVVVNFSPPIGVRVSTSVSIRIDISKIETEQTETPEETEEPAEETEEPTSTPEPPSEE